LIVRRRPYASTAVHQSIQKPLFANNVRVC
jgi:hypothetical protein